MYFTALYVSLKATDKAGQSETLMDVQGDFSLGSEKASQRETVDIVSRGKHKAKMFGAEIPYEPSWSAWDSVDSRRFVDFCLARGAVYGSGGTTPMQTVDVCAEVPAVILEVQIQPPAGSPFTRRYGRAYLASDRSVPESGATIGISFEAYDMTES